VGCGIEEVCEAMTLIAVNPGNVSNGSESGVKVGIHNMVVQS